ncbi:MAG: hypothetical protein ACRDD1_09060, partial [Planctomycetia bacterium]
LDARVEATFAPHTPPPVRQFLQGAPALPNKPQLEAWSRSVLRNQQERLPVPTFVRLEAESGGKLTVFGAGGVPHSFDKVATIGLRSLHRYFIALEGNPVLRDQKYYGTVEVLRGLRLPSDVKASDAPVPIYFTESDLAALSNQQMLTKIIVLEDPDSALPTPGEPGRPVVYEAPGDADAVGLAKELGRMVMVVRMGTRIPSADELDAAAAPQSLALPRTTTVPGPDGKPATRVSYVTEASGAAAGYAVIGDRAVERTAGFHAGRNYSAPPAQQLNPRGPAPEPARPGCVNGCGPKSANGVPMVSFAPNFTPPFPDDFNWEVLEYVCDGGDKGKKVDRNRDGVLINLDGGDTIGEYTDVLGKRRFKPSSEVCIYAPRYAEVRLTQKVEGYENRDVAVR